MLTGVVYDIRNTYNDVFFVVGGIYFIDAAIFAAIPLIKHRRSLRQAALYDDCADATKFSTFKVNFRNVASESSLANGEGSVSEYGTVSSIAESNSGAPAVDHVKESPFYTNSTSSSGGLTKQNYY